MKERCKNCKISRSFEDGPLGPKSPLTSKQSQEYIENMNEKDDLKRKPKNLHEQMLKESNKPYHDARGVLILPASWRENEEDDLTLEEYEEMFHEKF